MRRNVLRACAGRSWSAERSAFTFFAIRHRPNSRLPSVGSVAWGPYVADKGFEGEENHRRWLECYGARIIYPPKRNSRKRNWPKRVRRWVAGIRQIVETVYDKLFNAFGLWRERPHELEGLRARLAARVALHNFCFWLNEQLGRPRPSASSWPSAGVRCSPLSPYRQDPARRLGSL
jgi:hypothetical protein